MLDPRAEAAGEAVDSAAFMGTDFKKSCLKF